MSSKALLNDYGTEAPHSRELRSSRGQAGTLRAARATACPTLFLQVGRGGRHIYRCVWTEPEGRGGRGSTQPLSSVCGGEMVTRPSFLFVNSCSFIHRSASVEGPVWTETGLNANSQISALTVTRRQNAGCCGAQPRGAGLGPSAPPTR